MNVPRQEHCARVAAGKAGDGARHCCRDPANILLTLCIEPGLLEERLESVYKRAAGYDDKATSLFTLDLGPPQDLPDALRGESWLFVQLPLSLLREELLAVDTRQTFGANFPLDSAGLGDLPEDTMIPGALPPSD